MGDTVKLIIRNDLPFQAIEKKVTIDEAVEMLFENKKVDLLGREV